MIMQADLDDSVRNLSKVTEIVNDRKVKMVEDKKKIRFDICLYSRNSVEMLVRDLQTCSLETNLYA